jgi:hypothetical protein
VIARPGARPARGRLGVGGVVRATRAADGTLDRQGRGLNGALRHVAPFSPLPAVRLFAGAETFMLPSAGRPNPRAYSPPWPGSEPADKTDPLAAAVTLSGGNPAKDLEVSRIPPSAGRP